MCLPFVSLALYSLFTCVGIVLTNFGWHVGLGHWLRLWFSTVMDDNWSQCVIEPLRFVQFCGNIYFSEAPEFINSISGEQR